MKRPGLAWLAVGVLLMGAVSCFKDPTDSLRNGPSRLRLSRSLARMRVADTLVVTVQVQDDQGNYQSFAPPTYSTLSASIATVEAYPDTMVGTVPGHTLYKANVIAHAAGQTTVTITAGGVSDTIGVVSVYTALHAPAAVVSGPAGLDTTALGTAFTAGDTITITAPTGITFNSDASVAFGPNPGYTLSKTSTVIKAMARRGWAGPVTVNSITFDPGGGRATVALANLPTDSIQIQRARFRGTAVVTADPNFGAATVITVTNTGTTATFGATSGMEIGGVPPVGSTPPVATVPAIRLSQTATTMTGITALNATGNVLVTNVLIGAAAIDSLRGTAAGTVVTINKSSFPGTVTTANGTGALLDTIYVNSGGGATFTPASSVVTIGGVPTLIVGTRTAALLKVLAGRGVTGTVTVSNVIVAGVTIPSLTTANPITVSTTVTGDVNEATKGTAGAVVVTLGTAAAPKILYSTQSDANANIDDYYTFTIGAVTTVTLQLSMVGNGSGAPGATNPDLDLYVRNQANTAYVGGFGGGTAANPENLVLTNLAAGTYHINVEAFVTGGVKVVYRLSARGP